MMGLTATAPARELWHWTAAQAASILEYLFSEVYRLLDEAVSSATLSRANFFDQASQVVNKKIHLLSIRNCAFVRQKKLTTNVGYNILTLCGTQMD